MELHDRVETTYKTFFPPRLYSVFISHQLLTTLNNLHECSTECSRENIFEKAASSSDEGVLDPAHIGLVEEEFVEGSLINDFGG